MKYIGEHLLPGQIGFFFVVLSLVSSIVATIAYFRSAQSSNLEDEQSWKRVGRISFMIDAISVFAVFTMIFIIIRITISNTIMHGITPTNRWSLNIC